MLGSALENSSETASIIGYTVLDPSILIDAAFVVLALPLKAPRNVRRERVLETVLEN
jgi:hypothetical protein